MSLENPENLLIYFPHTEDTSRLMDLERVYSHLYSVAGFYGLIYKSSLFEEKKLQDFFDGNEFIEIMNERNRIFSELMFAIEQQFDDVINPNQPVTEREFYDLKDLFSEQINFPIHVQSGGSFIVEIGEKLSEGLKVSFVILSAAFVLNDGDLDFNVNLNWGDEKLTVDMKVRDPQPFNPTLERLGLLEAYEEYLELRRKNDQGTEIRSREDRKSSRRRSTSSNKNRNEQTS